MSLILDTGALIALESNDQLMWHRFKAALESGNPRITHGGVVAQVWRGGTGRQALLSQALKAIKTIPIDEELGRTAGVLLARSGLSDAIDAALVALSDHGDQILTSDPDDLALLATAGKRRVNVVLV